MSIQIHVSSTSPIATAMMPGTRILAISRSCSRSRLTQPHIAPHPCFPFFIRLGHSACGNAMTRPRGVQVFIGTDSGDTCASELRFRGQVRGGDGRIERDRSSHRRAAEGLRCHPRSPFGILDHGHGPPRVSRKIDQTRTGQRFASEHDSSPHADTPLSFVESDVTPARPSM